VTVERVHALQDLIGLQEPVHEAAARLREFPWDSERELVTLTRLDVLRVLAAYLRETLSAEEVEIWAFALEGRDDVGFEAGYDADIKEIVFQLAAPELNQRLTPELAAALRNRLSS
jgi:hypothetical protein